MLDTPFFGDETRSKHHTHRLKSMSQVSHVVVFMHNTLASSLTNFNAHHKGTLRTTIEYHENR
jgi:hypothetical protein